MNEVAVVALVQMFSFFVAVREAIKLKYFSVNSNLVCRTCF